MSNLIQDLNYQFQRKSKNGQDCFKIKKKLKKKLKTIKNGKKYRKPIIFESTEHQKKFKRKLKSQSSKVQAKGIIYLNDGPNFNCHFYSKSFLLPLSCYYQDQL